MEELMVYGDGLEAMNNERCCNDAKLKGGVGSNVMQLKEEKRIGYAAVSVVNRELEKIFEQNRRYMK